MATAAVVLAAGQGTRMRSQLPKVLHPVCGKPLLGWVLDAALKAGVDRLIVVGGPEGALADALPESALLATQAEARGTGDAVRAAAGLIEQYETVVVLSADVPLVSSDLISELAGCCTDGAAAAAVATAKLNDPTGYGRVVRGEDGSIVRIVETKVAGDATQEELAIDEVNAGIYAFKSQALLQALASISSDNAQGEYYLPDVLPILCAQGLSVTACLTDDPASLMGVNDRVDLAAVRSVAQARILTEHMRAGVTVVDPGSTLIEHGVRIAADAVIEPATYLRGSTSIGSGSRVGPATTVIDSQLGEGVTVLHSYLDSCRLADKVTVGPFAYLRPDAELAEGAKAGTFVEIKNSQIGAGAKVPHLSYIGDADVGERSNLGAGTITANYDGKSKHRTTIGKEVRGGVDTAFVAPVKVGDGAYTAAGSVIVEDVPAGALAVARERQRNIEDYADRSKLQSPSKEP